MFKKLQKYLKESWAEIKKVNWPTRAETWRHTLMVLTLSILVALILTFFDYLFKFILQRFI
jgi:preprotein translocase subunit SecE